MKNVICITHNADLDGFASGAIVKLKYPDAKIIGHDYGNHLVIGSEDYGKPIIMTDISLPMAAMEQLGKMSNNQFTWVDHHASKIREYNEYMVNREPFCTAVLEDGISACEGTWKYLFPERPMPRAVLLLGKYDTWRNQDADEWENIILPFQYGMRVLCNSVETFPYSLFTNCNITDDNIEKIIENGKTVLKYQSMVSEHQCNKGAFEYEFEGLRAICLNAGGIGSNAFKSVYDESKHDIMISFFFTGSIWKFSIYSTKDMDCSVIAKKYGGGGHRQACGFEMKNVYDIFTNFK